MSSNLLDFASYKRRFDLSVIYPGDVVEWRDYDDSLHQNVVRRIEYRFKDASIFGDGDYLVGKTVPVSSVSTTLTDTVIFQFDAGLSVAGCTFVRKVVNSRKSVQSVSKEVRKNV